MKSKVLCSARIGLAVLIGGAVATWDAAQPQAKAQVDLSVSLDIHSPTDFYSPLSPFGSWVEVSRYGRCWHPANIVTGWRPYTVGHWEWTDAGWYWVSDEPWSWACYHYGYWVLDPVYGWVWAPATQWAPAWVVWREAPDYIGWAPCGPGETAFSDSFFVFVDVHHFHDRLRPQELVFNDPGILRRSHRVGGFRTETRDFDGTRRRVAINQGPAIDSIQRATGTRFTPRPVTELVRQTTVPQSMRRNLTQPNSERSRVAQEPNPSRTGREQQRLYREAPPAQPSPTGRQEQRLYREAPNSQPAPQPSQPPAQPVPRRARPEPEVHNQQVPEIHRQPAPEFPRPTAPVPERAFPPTGREPGRSEPQLPRTQEPEPRFAPAPPARPEPVVPPRAPPQHERQKDREGE